MNSVPLDWGRSLGNVLSGHGCAFVVCRCRHAYPLFAELSNRYATDKLHFAKLDVGVWPHIARQLGMDLSAVSSQLPTVVCFEKGEETGR